MRVGCGNHVLTAIFEGMNGCFNDFITHISLFDWLSQNYIQIVEELLRVSEFQYCELL